MKIRYLGHSCFELIGNKNVLIDPFLSGNPKSAKLDIKPDIIAVTHGHSDHLGDTIELAKKYNCKVIAIHEISVYLGSSGIECEGMNKGGSIVVDGVKFTMTEAIHSSSVIDGFDGGCPAGFVIEYDNVCVYHAGDTALFGDMKLIGELYKPDIALLPIGDRYTMGINEAAIATKLIKPKIVIPMHYGTFPIINQTPGNFEEIVASMCDTKVVILKIGEEYNF